MGNTPLWYAVSGQHKPGAKCLLDHNADVNAINIDNETALHVACENEDSKMVSLLMAYGADLSIRNCRDMSAAMIADEVGCAAVCAALIDPPDPRLARPGDYATDSDSDAGSCRGDPRLMDFLDDEDEAAATALAKKRPASVRLADGDLRGSRDGDLRGSRDGGDEDAGECDFPPRGGGGGAAAAAGPAYSSLGANGRTHSDDEDSL